MNTRSGKRQPRSKEHLKGIMVYIPEELNIRLARYSEDWRVSKSRLVREGLESRIVGAKDDPYTKGFNEGLLEAVEICKGIALLQMMYPSGTPIWKHLEEQIKQSRRDKGASSEG